MITNNKDYYLFNDDCFNTLKTLKNKSIDLIFCDLPYGMTSCKWDSVLDLNKLWAEYLRIIKDNSAIILTASQPFTSQLVSSGIEYFRHEWIYKKRCASNFAQAKYAPMKEHESVLIFSKGKANYYPIKEKRVGSGLERSKHKYSDRSRKQCGEFVGTIDGEVDFNNDAGNDEMRYPSSVQEFNNRASGDRGFHPTQKPVALCEYFIRTYSQERAFVLDNCMGSGTTGVAAMRLNRRFIGIETETKYFDVAKDRLDKEFLAIAG